MSNLLFIQTAFWESAHFEHFPFLNPILAMLGRSFWFAQMKRYSFLDSHYFESQFLTVRNGFSHNDSFLVGYCLIEIPNDNHFEIRNDILGAHWHGNRLN